LLTSESEKPAVSRRPTPGVTPSPAPEPPVIAFDRVSKRFRRSSGADGLKDFLLGARKRRQAAAGDPKPRWIEAVRDVSLTLERGEALALVGRNGSGKSTCLSLAAGVLVPSEGTVDIRGRVSPLLALGAGVHPDLTGRENVQLNGVLLGMTRREVRQRFAAIHDFSELGDFIDQPVRQYSTGMLARLAFSVATHLEPEILIVDEILAVGDASFQAKCHERIADFRARGLTMLYVSHEVSTVMSLCDRAVYLSGGAMVAEGDPETVCAKYYEDQGMVLPPRAVVAADESAGGI